MENHLDAITHAIQLAVAPVFLLTAIGTLIGALNLRLGRAVDRRRILEQQLRASGAGAPEVSTELAALQARMSLIYFAILAAVTSALLVCLVVASAFVGALLSSDFTIHVAVLFILAMVALVVALILFLREIFVAVSAGRVIERQLTERGG